MSTYLVTGISFQFIDLVTHQTSTLRPPQVGNPRSRKIKVSTQEKYCHSGLGLYYPVWPLSLEACLLGNVPPRALADWGVFKKKKKKVVSEPLDVHIATIQFLITDLEKKQLLALVELNLVSWAISGRLTYLSQ